MEVTAEYVAMIVGAIKSLSLTISLCGVGIVFSIVGTGFRR